MQSSKKILMMTFVMCCIACTEVEPTNSQQPQLPWPPPVPENTLITLDDKLDRQNFEIVLDGSGSMMESKCSGNTNKIEAAKAAIEEFVKKIPSDANIGLIVFDAYGVQERLPLVPNDEANRQKFIALVKSVHPDGGTPLDTAIGRALDTLIMQSHRQLSYGSYHLVVVTDGEASGGHDPRAVVDKIVNNAWPVKIQTVGFCISGNHSLNQPGRTDYYAADNIEELRKALTVDILTESTYFDASDFKK